MKIIFVIGIAILLIAGFLFYLYNRGLKIAQKWYKDNSETIDGEVSFDSIVSFIKSTNPDKEKDVPFMVKGENEEFKKFSNGRPFPENKYGYQVLFVGVYDNKAGAISNCRVIYAKSFDLQINDIFGNDSLVVLS